MRAGALNQVSLFQCDLSPLNVSKMMYSLRWQRGFLLAQHAKARGVECKGRQPAELGPGGQGKLVRLRPQSVMPCASAGVQGVSGVLHTYCRPQLCWPLM